jgi:Cys-tRNA(Pro)/Cys-tRNA(Cys) deacylase
MEAGLSRKRRVSLRLIQLGKVRTANRVGCPFWVDINSAVGRKAGLTDEKLQALKGSDFELFNVKERLVIELADAMVETPSNISDELYQRLRAQFSEEQLLELAAQFAFENYRARLNRVFDVGSDNLYHPNGSGWVVTQKTNAVRLLEQFGISYELREYEVDPDDLTAETVADKIGLPPEQVFKTLIARGDRNGLCFAVVPGDAELNLKALATASGDRKIQLVPLKEVQPLTGYIRGGVTALAGKKDYPVFVDETIELFDVISISAGVRGIQILLAPGDYIHVTHAMIAAIAESKIWLERAASSRRGQIF